MLLDIVILPPALIRAKVGKFARTLAKSMPARYVVDNKKFIPHLSLFHLKIHKNTLPRLMEIISRIVRNKGIKKIKIQGGVIKVGETSCEVALRKIPQLTLLAESVVQSCNHLRVGKMPWILNRRPNNLERKLLNKFGNSWTIGKNFQPHFTLLANFLNKNKIRMLSRKYKINFTVTTIAICQVNDWSQVTKIIKQFKVK